MEIKEQFVGHTQVGLIIESDELVFVVRVHKVTVCEVTPDIVRVHKVTVYEVTPDIDLIADAYSIMHIRPFRGTGHQLCGTAG